jgi:hypothetical protein
MSDNWASHSQLTQYRHCPQAWQYNQIRRLTALDRDDVKVEMHFGAWWHLLLAVDSLERGRKKGSLQQLPQRLSAVDDGPVIDGKTLEIVEVDMVIVLAADWWAKQPAEHHEEWINRIGEPLPTRLANLYRSWYERWENDIETEAPLAVEVSWTRELPPMPGPDGYTNPDTELLGYVDEVYFDEKRGMVVVRDHKTAKGLPTQSTVDDMMDSQLQLYAWGASPTITGWGYGKIQATAYDRARMVAPRPPQLTLSGRLTYRDGKPMIGGTDLHTYLQWCREGVEYPGVKKDGTGAGVYLPEEAIVEQLSTPASQSIWFQRTLTPLNGNLIKAHLRAAVDSAHDIILTRARVEVAGEAARNLSNGCRWCDYVSLCRAEMVGGPDGDYVLADHNLRQR